MSWRNLVWLGIVAGLAGLSLYLAGRQPPHVDPHDPAVDELVGAITAYKTIRQHSYPRLSPEDASRGAIEGMVRQVDEYSVYLGPDKAAWLGHRLKGELETTGLLVCREGGRLLTVGVLPGSPAHEADLRGGLEVLAVNDVPSEYLSLAEARRALEGPDPVRLRLRAGGGAALERTVAPARFPVPTVTGLVGYDVGKWMHALDERAGVYYVRIGEFVERTPTELQSVYRRLEEPRGLVLDLRGNPGGTLTAAAEVADLFLSSGLIVRVVGRDGERPHYAHDAGTYPPVPMVVLIDSQTASAAEIVAGALQAHGRAVVVGECSVGKWGVQTQVRLGYGLGEVYMTTGEYFLPERLPATLPATRPAAPGSKAGATATAPAGARRPGLTPDVTVRLTVSAREELDLLRLKAQAAQLPGPTPTTLPVRLSQAEKLTRAILAADAQLSEAVRLLRQPQAPTAPGTSPTGPAGRRSPAP